MFQFVFNFIFFMQLATIITIMQKFMTTMKYFFSYQS